MKRKLNEQNVPTPVEGEKDAAPAPALFDSFGLDVRLLQAVAAEGFSKPTPVQAQAIPLALEGRDIIGMKTTPR